MSFIKCIDNAGYKVGRQRAFCDFLTLTVYAFSAREKETQYKEVASIYTANELKHFSEALFHLIEEMDNHGQGLKDCLGDYFMEVLASERRGQFFTPQTICDFMAQILQPEGETVSDPCCGSGRMFLSAAKVNRFLRFYGADIDLQCCQMTLINMCLNGLFGEVSHMDTLQFKEWRRWRIEKHPIYQIPYIREIDLTEVKPTPEILKHSPKPEIKAIQTTLDSLFSSSELF